MPDNVTRRRFSVRSAIATYFGMDVAEVKETRYQPTRTPCAVYATGNEYFTAAPIGRKPKGSDDARFGTWVWSPIDDARVAAHGYQNWQHAEEPGNEA